MWPGVFLFQSDSRILLSTKSIKKSIDINWYWNNHQEKIAPSIINFCQRWPVKLLVNWIEGFIKIIEFFGKDQLVSSFLAWTLSSREVWMTLLLSYQVLICFSTWRVYISFFSYNFRFDTKKQVCQMNTARLLHKGNSLYPFLRNSISEN